MKLQPSSFLLGVGVAVSLMATRHRLRPVAVEIGALCVHMARLGRALVERQIEHAEDLFAEVDRRVREREGHVRRREPAHAQAARAVSGNGARAQTNGGA